MLQTASRKYLSIELLEKRSMLSAVPTIVKDIVSGLGDSTPKELIKVNGKLFFSADDGVHGRELWVSDGTASGTQMVRDIRPGNASSNPRELTDVNGTLFFVADQDADIMLWKSDGSELGTTKVLNEGSGPYYASPSQLTRVNNTLFFSAYHPDSGVELWRSNGTPAGTMFVKDMYDIHHSNPDELTDVNGMLFFTAFNQEDGRELWKSDGTPDGTVMVEDINLAGSGWPFRLTDVNGTLFFRGDGGATGYELWKSDGTAAGTEIVRDINPGFGSSDPDELTSMDGMLYFTAHDNEHGREVWRSDGTAVGTQRLKDIQPGWGTSYPGRLTNVSGTLFFSVSLSSGGRLWKSNGTPGGTVPVANLQSHVEELTDVNGVLYFTASDRIDGFELWRSDGTEAGTEMAADIYPGADHSFPAELTLIDDTLFFTATDGTRGVELWKLDVSTPVANGTWDGGGDGVNWSDPLNWTNNVLPTAADNVRIDSPGSFTVNLSGSFTSVKSLQLGGSASAPTLRLSTGGGKLLKTGSLTINGDARLDLNDNDLILDYAAVSQLDGIESLINAGRNDGDWLGAGLTSSAARIASPQSTMLGAMESAEFLDLYGPTATFNGQPLDSSMVLVKYTYFGDTDFNGAVDFDDYVHADSGFNNHASGWRNGDFDLNGIVDFDDYVMLDFGFNTQSGVL